MSAHRTSAHANQQIAAKARCMKRIARLETDAFYGDVSPESVARSIAGLEGYHRPLDLVPAIEKRAEEADKAIYNARLSMEIEP